ncbi:hypothetical protein D3C87_1847710 [compost metagenome]
MICVGLSTVKPAGMPPKVTEVTPLKLVPVMTTCAPPSSGPDAGESWAITGAWVTVRVGCWPSAISKLPPAGEA